MRSLVAALFVVVAWPAAAADKPFRIRLVDDATGRGVPLVELKTTNHVAYVSDSAGQVAFDDLAEFGGDVFFFVKSHGYRPPKDGFGFEGVRLKPTAGGEATIRLKRENVAERVCRLTGSGRFRDSVLLGDDIPAGDRQTRGGVLGQDSIQHVVYHGKNYWFWGDTNRAAYPLGLFRMAGATSPLFRPGQDSLDRGVPYEYFTDPSSGFARAMMPYPEKKDGVIWLSGYAVVPESAGAERMVCHFSRRKSLSEQIEHGFALFDDVREIFVPVRELPTEESWRFVDTHPVVVDDEGTRWLMWGEGPASMRVPAELDAILDLARYEAFTCLKEGSTAEKPVVDRDASGRARWRWQRELPPVTGEIEQRLLGRGELQPEEARFSPEALGEKGKRVRFSSGSVRFNRFRNRWILIGGQWGGSTSFLGEVWYSEADAPTGPFHKAVKIVTHDQQSFYNVCHHDVFDEQNGQVVYFEGTYTNSFTKAEPTPRYDYNQVLYRLDLANEALKAAR
jgi:hypothetical protein